MKLGAHGKSEETKMRGRDDMERERAGVEFKAWRRWSPRELEMEGGGGEGGKVWKLADRTGYAQTESQAQAQT